MVLADSETLGPSKTVETPKTVETEAHGLRVEALAARAGISVDTVRYYQKLGLLDAPVRKGRVAYYGKGHEQRLDRIAELAKQGFTLAQITALVVAPEPDPLLAQLASHAQAVAGLGRAELARRSGLDQGLVDLVVDAGLIVPVKRTAGEETFGADAVTMLQAAASLLSSGLPVDQLAALVSRHAQHVDRLVADAIELFRASSDHDRAGQGELVRELVPVVSGMVAAHFERTLIDRAIARLDPPGDAP